jgi:RNA polymerase sigma-70 factor (ECF subfamily)
MDESSGDLMARWRQGDQQAAAALFARYVDRLVLLARSRMSSKVSRHLDPEDVVHSAYRTFFADAGKGRFELHRGGDLWRLLVTITLHKLQHQVEKLNTKKRAIEREQHFGSEDSLLAQHVQVLGREPSPLAALMLTDQLEELMRALDPPQRRMLELRLQGHDLEEIARACQKSEATVRRLLDRVKDRLRTLYPEANLGEASAREP